MTIQKEPNRVTLKDIARRAGVSVTTVSDTLNDTGRVSDETRARVKQLAADLDYVPSAAARSLVGGRTGLLVMSIAAPNMPASALSNVEFFATVMSSAAFEASSLGYALALAPMSSPMQLAYEGAIVIDPSVQDGLVDHAIDGSRPLVTIGRAEGVKCWVDNNYDIMVSEVLDHFWEQGARSPGLLLGSTRASYAQDCLESYMAWCVQRDVIPKVEEVQERSEKARRQAARRLLVREERPDAVFATLDNLATSVASAAEDVGLVIPDDLLLASLGDSASLTHGRIPITALDLSPATLGAEAARCLVQWVESGLIPDNRIFTGNLRVRASTVGAS